MMGMATLFETMPEPRPLRPHQVLAMTMLRQSIGRGNKRVVCQMPTGAGKTRLAAEIVTGALSKGKTVAFTVPAISLIDQTLESFEHEGIADIGVMQATHERTDLRMPVQICSVQTLVKRGCPDTDIAIVDECHIASKAITDWMAKRPQTLFIGLSATPWRRGMAKEWQDLVCPVRMQDLIDDGYLSPFRVYAPSHPDLSNVRTKAGDYHEGDLANVMGDSVLVADIVETWLKRAERRPTLVFAVDRAHAAKLQEQFGRAGVAMGYCDANVDRIERRLLFQQMAEGRIAGIVNVGTLTTGVDADVRCIVLARPTKSEMLHVQIVGRALRTAHGKVDALILDHADNHSRLGFVTDIHHDALLGGEKSETAQKEKKDALPKECSACGIMKAPKVRECPACGFTPSRQSDIETEEGELREIKRAPAKADKATKQRVFSQLLSVADKRGRSKGWVGNSYRDIFGVWPVGLSQIRMEPSEKMLNWVRAKDIRFAKGRAKQNDANG